MQCEQTVAILMCTYNGATFLEEQLDSIVSQTHQRWRLTVSDDGSTDATLDILQRFQKRNVPGKVEILTGPRRGFAENFLSLALKEEGHSCEYFAFCDQDDIWLPDKLKRALETLSIVIPTNPAAYGSRTELITEIGVRIGASPHFSRPPSFLNALTQSIAGGNTIVFNLAALKLLKSVGVVEIVSHDWWVYLLVTGSGGEFIFDMMPSVLYRQHRKNLVGANTSISGQLGRVKAMLKGRYRKWGDVNASALRKAGPFLTEANRKAFLRFERARNSNFLSRLPLLLRSKVRRQSFFGNCGLALAFLIKRA